MAAKKRAGRKASRTARRDLRPRKKASARKRITVRAQKRGLEGAEIRLELTSPEVAPLVAEVEAAGGAAIGAYREPLSGRPLLLASLPIGSVEPTPFQRDLSPTHAKRLAQRIEESGCFLDPLIVVVGFDGALWTPNGRHRLASAKVLGLRQVTALISPDQDLAFKILALNTEKAHNLRDRSLEVIRMARELAARRRRARESEFVAEFEEPQLLTLGLAYEENKRFGGGAYGPFLKKVERWSERTLAASLRERAGWAARLLEIDVSVKRIVEALRKRGFESPHLRTYVVARINPVRFHRARKGDAAPPMATGAALTRMAAAARRFDASSVRERDLALVAAVASDGGD